jgi:poly(hydroxyalkanoate) depolymerase family esterase
MTRQPSSKLLRSFVTLLLAIATIPMVAAPSFAQGKGKREVKTFQARPQPPGEALRAGAERFSFPRKYLVYTPSGYDPNQAQALPLVMVLHGCLEVGSTDLPLIETIERDTKFDELADQERFIVVYPNHRLDLRPGESAPFCWEFWIDSNIHEGRGEVADLAAIVEEVKRDYKVDPNRIHITGISSGGAMTVAALVAYSEIFASGSPTAGVPYSETEMDFMLHMYKPVDEIAAAMTAEMGANKWPVPILIIQSEADETVNPRYAANIRDSWGKVFGVDTQIPVSPPVSDTTKGTPWTHAKYGRSPEGNTVVETLFLHPRPDGQGLKHGWYGDGDAQFAFSNAPDTARLVWEFFKAHPMPPKPPSSRSAADTPR